MSNTEAMNASIERSTWTSGNGGNTIDHGEALRKPVYTGNDLIDGPMPAHILVGLVACSVLFLAFLGWIAVRWTA